MKILYGLYVLKSLLKYKYNYIKEIFFSYEKKKVYNKYFKNFIKKKLLKINFVKRSFLTNLSKTNNHQGICIFVDDSLFTLKKKSIY